MRYDKQSADSLAERHQPKFGPALDRFYPGAPTPEIGLRCEAAINEMIGLLTANQETSERLVLRHFSKLMKGFRYEDTEEIEEAGHYCEKIMRILDIKSSRGILNRG